MTAPLPEDIDETSWKEACRRAAAMRKVLGSNTDQTSAADIAYLANQLGLSRASVFRLIKLFRESGTVMSLVDRKRGRPIGHPALDERQEKIIQNAIRKYYLKPTRPPVSQLVRDIQTDCTAAGLKPPHRRTIEARLNDMDNRLGRVAQNFIEREPALPNLIRAAVGGRVRHILDWWYISMRVQHIENAVKGLLQAENFPGFPEPFKRPAETLRWCLWHGKIMTTGTRLKLLMIESGRITTEDAAVRATAARVKARCRELYTYLANNWDALTNHGWRHRNGFSISSSRAEGCVDDIGNTRMGIAVPSCHCVGNVHSAEPYLSGSTLRKSLKQDEGAA